jgi:hypothetical protein
MHCYSKRLRRKMLRETAKFLEQHLRADRAGEESQNELDIAPPGRAAGEHWPRRAVAPPGQQVISWPAILLN